MQASVACDYRVTTLPENDTVSEDTDEVDEVPTDSITLNRESSVEGKDSPVEETMIKRTEDVE